MPWDATRLRVAPILQDGSIGPSELAAGGPEESIVQPEWSPDGVLHLVSDRSGWWNLYRILEGPRLEPLAPMEAEFADPSWIFNRSSYGFLADASILAVARPDGRDRLFHIAAGRAVGEVDIAVHRARRAPHGASAVVAIAGSPSEAALVATFDPVMLAPVRRPTPVQLRGLDPAWVSEPEPIAFPSTRGRIAHALVYRPVNPEFVGPAGERPPLVVISHGGPTSNASTALNLEIQLQPAAGSRSWTWTTRGSTGYGRAYRTRSTASGASPTSTTASPPPGSSSIAATSTGSASPSRAAARAGTRRSRPSPSATSSRPGSATSGWATSRRSRATPTSSRRATWTGSSVRIPEAAAVYRQRSPVHYLDEISCPVLVLQGLDDKIVPPAQAEAIVAALAANHIPHAYLPFAGEGHGFRGADAIRRSLEGELSFLAAVFGSARRRDRTARGRRARCLA